MKENFNKQLLLGTLIGILTPILFLPVLILFLSLSKGIDFEVIWSQISSNNMNTSKYLSLAMIVNLLWFYYFLNKEQYHLTRGIILGMICFAPYMVYIYFFQ
ncbi:MAG: hypothetical protein CBB76_05970 [Crocinitomicaceae bacterium TMED16]|nr:MAG: hypothetical protein CBB76_05970 [Crocinitomicaceae bacterium TMED16]|tara:strand:+ start:3271 stop:3576 length:306 start_codon:yes stop_codon:yes gene_type:complete